MRRRSRPQIPAMKRTTGRCPMPGAEPPSGWPMSSPPRRWTPSTRVPTRAVQTVEPLARRTGVEISLVDDLRERLLSPRALPDWRERLQRAWTNFGYALSDGESSAEARRRVTGVLETLRRRHPGARTVVASHGNLIALALHAIVPDQVDFEFWAAMPTPAVYVLPIDGPVSGPGLGD